LVLEIGFGMGDSLLEMAKNEPDKDFIGIEVHPPGVGKLINEAGKAGIKNLRVYMADAMDVLEDCIADGAIDRLQLYFPDPWHKARHNKRRLIQAPFVTKLASKLKVGGYLHAATDWQNYAEQILEILSAESKLKNTSVHANGYADKPSYRPLTKFENRGIKLGHGVWDVVFKKC
jgi:tRNA (guanine-N7-)-methyltransferase